MASLKTQTFFAETKGGKYPITVGMRLERELAVAVKGEAPSRVAVVSDENVGAVWGADVLSALASAGIAAELLTFPAGERSKTQATASGVQEELLKKRFGRDSLIVALGGGVVGDVAGYVAATFLRGVPFVQVPTTLLAMVDSSIGGKVGVDTEYGKNTIGAFWQPKAVIADIAFLKGLPKREFVSGLLEAVKSFFTADKEALALVDALDLDDPLSTEKELQDIVVRAVKFKAGVVARDEREENERRILNFGHTVGHSIELLSGYAMPHGFAVGYGMLVETKIAEELGILSPEDRAVVAKYLVRFGIAPEGLKEFGADDVLETMKGDKKTRGGAIYCVLLSGIGSVSTEGGQFAHPVAEDVIRKAFEEVRSEG